MWLTRTTVFLLAAWAAALPAATREEDLREAARLDAERNCAEAERLYRRAAAGAPDSPALWNNLGNHYLVCGQPEQAQTWFERLLRVNPSHANANLQLARLAIARKQETKALEYLRQVPDSGPAVRLLRAEALYGAGQRTAALAEFNGLQNESDAAVLAALGLTTARLGLFDRAEAAFQAALARRPGDLGLMFYLGRAAARAQHYDRARQVLDVVLAHQPENIEVLFELGRVYAALHDPSRAVYLLSQARQRAPRSPEILLALARAAEDAGYYGDAALAYDGYLTLRPTDDAARRDRALVYGYSGSRLAEGIAELTRYLQRYPRDPVAHYDLAQLIWKTEPEKALEQLHAAIRLKTDSPSALFSRAWLLHRLGRTTEALPDLQAAARLAPGNPRVLALLGVVHLALDQPAEAERCLRQALSGAPEDPAILMHLGRALMELGREQEAQPFLAKFQQVRPRMARVPRQEAGMIELAT
ncbi:MAG TPA: tetratricopeptide repeat protein, partial [Bryobacteraceae bacterium]|nr:tetratricopeptide repeat protein [Bryobacteraceae bacterium]